MGKDKGAEFETFDSGDGPTVPEKHKGDMDHHDAKPSDNGVATGDVPIIPQKG